MTHIIYKNIIFILLISAGVACGMELKKKNDDNHRSIIDVKFNDYDKRFIPGSSHLYELKNNTLTSKEFSVRTDCYGHEAVRIQDPRVLKLISYLEDHKGGYIVLTYDNWDKPEITEVSFAENITTLGYMLGAYKNQQDPSGYDILHVEPYICTNAAFKAWHRTPAWKRYMGVFVALLLGAACLQIRYLGVEYLNVGIGYYSFYKK